MTVDLHWYVDPRDFLAVARGFLAVDPVISTVVATVASRAAARLDDGGSLPQDQPWWFVVVRDAGGEIAGVAMRTAPFRPHPLWLLPMPDEAARAIGAALLDRGEAAAGTQIGLSGALPATRACSAVLEAAGCGPASVLMHSRLFRLGDLRPPRRPVGELRCAIRADVELVHDWIARFHGEADEQAGRTQPEHDQTMSHEEVIARLDAGTLWLWEVDSVPVHLTGVNAPAHGVARIGPVYTPAPHRGRGYAGWVVAALSQQVRDAGAEPCLFTDQANPVSNRLYESIGYVPVTDTVELVVGPVAQITRPGPA